MELKDAQKPDHISLNTLIARLREGRFVIPDFQRDFEWKPWDIRELMRSIFLDYYIGSLLLWKGNKKNFKALACEKIYGFNHDGNPEHIVLDGQQRLTALHYVFFAPDIPLPNRASRCIYFIRVDRFMNEVYDEAFEYEWLTRRWSKILSNPNVQYEGHIFPLPIVGEEGWALPNWVQNYQKYWEEKAKKAIEEGEEANANEALMNVENAKAFGEHLREITGQYQISFIELDQDLAIDKVCDIFTQINSRGIRLDVFDLINAMLKPRGLQLRKMWRAVEPRFEFVDTGKMNVYILQVMSILKQGYCSPKYLYYLLPEQEKTIRESNGTLRKEVLVPDIEDFKKYWNHAIEMLETAIKLLRHPQEFGVISSKYIPYVSILPAFAAMQAYKNTLPPNRQIDAKRKIKHWYWASIFLNRYSGSVESTTARDFNDLKAWIANDVAKPALIEEFKSRFRNLDLRKEVKRGSSVYNGIFNLLVIKGAMDWRTGDVPQHDDLDDHHIVPYSWGKSNVEGNLIHSILNRTPLTAETNRYVIKDRLPNVYLPEMIEANDEDTVRSIFESHFISGEAFNILLRSPFTEADYEDFISERQKTLMEAIEDLLIKERLDLSPRLRELDQQLEKIELGLRKTVDKALDNDLNSLPQHINEKCANRIQTAAKKNAALDIEQYKMLSKRLEFCDLRDLQNIVTYKSLWEKFENMFKSKEALNAKFEQVAELRNGIRHSRTVNEITKKEGEAAISWFNEILKKNK